MKVEVRRAYWDEGWLWSCPVCHYGNNIPGESAPSWRDALADAESHIELHRVIGMRLEWAPVRIPYAEERQ